MEFLSSRRRAIVAVAWWVLGVSASLGLAMATSGAIICEIRGTSAFHDKEFRNLFRGWSRAALFLIATLGPAAGLAAVGRTRVSVKGEKLQVNDRPFELIAPATVGRWNDRRCLILNTKEGPLGLCDVFALPLSVLADSINASLGWGAALDSRASPCPTTGDRTADHGLRGLRLRGFHLHDYGRKVCLSPTWFFLAILVPLVLTDLLLSGGTSDLSVIAVLISVLAPTLIALTVMLPTHRHSRWMLISDDWIVAVNDGVWILPTSAVSEVAGDPMGLAIRCRKGVTVNFPDGSLEREVAQACGLPEDRYISTKEAARLLNCSRIAAFFTLSGWHLDAGTLRMRREDFMARLKSEKEGRAR